MSTNCLVTKLKGVVNNSQLLPMGYVRIHANSIGNEFNEARSRLQITIDNGETCTISTTDGGYFATSFAELNTNRLTTYTITANSTVPGSSTANLFFANGDYDILISNKYSIKILANNNSVTKTIFNGNVDDFKYSNSLQTVTIIGGWNGQLSAFANKLNLTQLYLDSTNIFGDIKDIQTDINLTNITLNRCSNIYGNIDDLAPLTSLVSFFAADVAGIGGTIDGFVSGQINSGRATNTTNPINIFRALSFATFNGKSYPTENSYCYISWESASKIAVYAGAYGYSSCPRIYCKGYTQEEAETKWSGKTIVRVDA